MALSHQPSTESIAGDSLAFPAPSQFQESAFWGSREGYGSSDGKSMWSERKEGFEAVPGNWDISYHWMLPSFPTGSSGSDIMVSDCRHKEQMSDCSYTRSSPVFGFWIFSRCCLREFCNNPQNRVFYIP